ncbi:MAG: DinB family protein [Saprospiraceae bacterium]|nr:DinB family protein [Saprospiraceae bacterium]
MNYSRAIAKHFRDVFFGGNWTCVNYKDVLQDVNWEQANKQIFQCNSIAVLVYHVDYYIRAQLDILSGRPLTSKDAESFKLPGIQGPQDWEDLLAGTWKNVEEWIEKVEQLPDSELNHVCVDEKYGNYYRNLHGIIEHTHYHLGQIVLIKKIISLKDERAIENSE